MKISLIAAMANNRVIGKENKMLWHLPADLAWFKRNTLHKPVIMGRKTFESIGRALPNRVNVVISRQQVDAPNIVWASTPEQALEKVQSYDEVMIIGGETIYRHFLPLASRLYLTHIDLDIVGDTYFPDYTQQHWTPVFSEPHQENGEEQGFTFEILEKRAE